MNRFQNKPKITTSLLSITVFLFIVLFGIITAAFGKAEVSGMIVLIYVIIICYYSLFTKIKRSTNYSSILCDSRFYVFTTILMYSILPPIYCILTLEENGGARVRTAYNATIYTADELFKTLIMSTLLFLGITLGFFLRERTKGYDIKVDNDSNEIDDKVGRKFFGWLIVCVISTLLFYIPFIRGGFRVIQLGGSILDVDRTISSGVLGNFQEIFFSADLMTASTVAMLYYAYKLNIGQRSRRVLLIVTVLLQTIGALLTTRRARALSIILCAFVIYVYWYEKRKRKLPWTQIIIAASAVGFLYLLEVFMGQRQTNGGIASYIRLFDGISAYDSLLRSTRELPTASMLSNIIYGLFRPVPIFGKYIVEFLGMPTDAAPLYHWMAERYATYQIGGGLAYTPQLEAYLCLGYFGCFLFGIVYGFAFGKKRSGLVNLFVIAMAFSIARGTIQVALKLVWTFWVFGFCFYDQLLFSRVSFGTKARRINNSVGSGDTYVKG